MKTKSLMEPIPARRLAVLRRKHERRHRSRWAGSKGWQCCKVLPLAHGDGKLAVLVSFFAAPELSLMVFVDSELRLELPLEQRCAPSPPPSFRDLTETIYNLCEDTWEEPPVGRYRLRCLRWAQREDGGPDDGPSLWSVVFQYGSTWVYA